MKPVSSVATPQVDRRLAPVIGLSMSMGREAPYQS
jgi:hypothetical protein